MRLYDGVGLAFGPTTGNGYYYDFDLAEPIREEDFPRIEAEMAVGLPPAALVARAADYDGIAVRSASKVTADWHGWLHHTYEEPPTRAPLPKKTWEKPHSPNMTGTPEAYRPKGSLARDGVRAKATGDYEAWSPEG